MKMLGSKDGGQQQQNQPRPQNKPAPSQSSGSGFDDMDDDLIPF